MKDRDNSFVRPYSRTITSLAVIFIMLVTVAISPIFQKVHAQSNDITINGAGATFPFPLIDSWRNEYQKIEPQVNINYQSIGSGGGIKQFTEKTVDFGASDAPLSESERERAPNAVHIPETIGSVVVSYNLSSVPEKGLHLTGPIIADIFLGKITKWNDPAITSLNTNLVLSDSEIIVTHRSDGSGTTFVWTDFLSKVSPEWQQRIGIGKSVQWPTGVGALGNEGVANVISGTPNTIGYVELSYAISTKMPYAFLQNQEGNFIEPSFDSIQAAITTISASLPKGDASWTGVSSTNAPGKDSYPIASFSYLMLYKDLADNPSMSKEKAQELVNFVTWAVTDGQSYSKNLGYVPLPDSVVKLNQETLQMMTYNGLPIPPTISNGNEQTGSNGVFGIIAVVAASSVAGFVIYRRMKSKFHPTTEVDYPSRDDRKKRLSLFFLKENRLGDRIFKVVAIGAAGYTAFLMALVAYSTFAGSSDIFAHEGFFGFVFGTDWNPVEGRESYGALPYIIGTLASAGIAMAIGVPISLGIAIFVSEISTNKLGASLSFVIELLAAVPSIIYGLWALFVFRFWVRDLIELPLSNAFGGTIPLFAKTPFGLDIFTAGIVLAIMIIPTVSSISREVMRVVPNSQREAAYSLGATRWEAVWTAVFPYARSGLLGASILGLGRAVGETMLVTMIIGNATGLGAIPTTLFSPSQTLSSLIANQFNEANTELHVSALVALGAVLFMITIMINIAARMVISYTSKMKVHKMKNNRQPSKMGTGDLPPTEVKNNSAGGSVNVIGNSTTGWKGHSNVQAIIRKESSKRTLINKGVTLWTIACVVAAIVPLGSILLEVGKNGTSVISIEFLTQTPGAIGSRNGGIGPAVQGTLLVVGLGSLIAAPVGILAGIYLSEFAGKSRFADVVRFLNDALTGLPSIVIGIVAFVTIVLWIGTFSVLAGAFALSIIMIPIVVRVTEETLKIVPNTIREAGYSLGIPKWKITLFVVVASAKNGILTGIVLGISRITGETAPLIMTILGTSLFFTSLVGPVDALPLRIWRLASQPYESAHDFGWGAALILILMVLTMNISLRFLAQRKGGLGAANT